MGWKGIWPARPTRGSSTEHAISEVSHGDKDFTSVAPLTLTDLATEIRGVKHELAVLRSQVRAEPFKADPEALIIYKEGMRTLGFEGVEELRKYADFEDVFRGSEASVRQVLDGYMRWLPHQGNAVDLGCGRGEMLAAMTDHGLVAHGVDADLSMVDRASRSGLTVHPIGIDEFLENAPSSSYDVITAIHVVEHAAPPTVVRWLRECQRILRPGGVLIVETPNPHAIDAFKAFWIDRTHIRPYYPESLLFDALEAGFGSAFIWANGESDDLMERLATAGSFVLVAAISH